MGEGGAAKTSAARAGAPGKAGRLGRSRAACTNCHKAKQRCEGPSVCPCHRCVTFGVECIFPSNAGPVMSRSTLPSRASPIASNSSPSPAPSNTYLASGPDLAEQLRLMTARLESIESSMASLTRATVSSSCSSNNHNKAGSQSVSDRSPQATTSLPPPPSVSLPEFPASTSNPVEIAGEGLLELADPSRAEESSSSSTWTIIPRPDVIDRGILSLSEVQNEFTIYFENIHPWSALLSIALDRDPLVIRERNPLLFHAILITTLYYRPRTPANLILYRSVSAILDSILAPHILCPQPDQLNADLIRALYLLLLYKPIQLNAMSARGESSLAAVEHMSKLNVRASWLLRTLCIRVSLYINLPSATTAFARAFADQAFEPISDELVHDQRLYFSCIWHSLHGGLQSGSRVDFIPQEAIRTTRLFAKLKRQPSDVRLAASVELACIAAAVLHNRQEHDQVRPTDLIRFGSEMQEWEEYWIPTLDEVVDEDPISYSTSHPYASFVRVVIWALPFSRYTSEKKELAKMMSAAAAASGSSSSPEYMPPPAPKLTIDDHSALNKAVAAAEGMLLALTTEGRFERQTSGKQLVWGPTTPLTLDEQVISQLRWASDSLTCVVYSYSLLFLVKLANEGILRPDLTLISFDSEPYTSGGPLDANEKLCRLLQLGADVLDAVAANAFHPAVKQARFLRRLREAGIAVGVGVGGATGDRRNGGRSGTWTTPNSPRTVSSNLTTAPYGGTLSSSGEYGNVDKERKLDDDHHAVVGADDDSLGRQDGDGFDFGLGNGISIHSTGAARSTPSAPTSTNGATTAATTEPIVEDFSSILGGISPSMFDSSFFGVGVGGLDSRGLDATWSLGDYDSFTTHF